MHFYWVTVYNYFIVHVEVNLDLLVLPVFSKSMKNLILPSVRYDLVAWIHMTKVEIKPKFSSVEIFKTSLTLINQLKPLWIISSSLMWSARVITFVFNSLTCFNVSSWFKSDFDWFGVIWVWFWVDAIASQCWLLFECTYCISRNFREKIFSRIWLKQTFCKFLYSRLSKGIWIYIRVSRPNE